MADNFETNAASGGVTFASDDIAGVHYPYAKQVFGGDGVATPVTTSAGLPVQQQSGASFVVGGAAADGAAVSGNPVRIAGSDGTNTQDIAVTTAGHVQIHDGGNSITVDGAVAATQSGTWNVANISGTVSLPTGAATDAKLDTIIGHVDGLEGLLTTIDADTGGIATSAATIAGAVSGTEMQVDVVTSALPTGAATETTLAGILTELGQKLESGGSVELGATTLAALETVQIGSIAAGDNNIGNVDVATLPNVTLAAGTNTNEIVGDAAHDAPVQGNPVRIGARALSAAYTAVADGDTADLITDLIGRLVTSPYALPAQLVKGATSDITGTTSTQVLAAPGAGLKNYVTQLTITNSHATVGTFVDVLDGNGGTILYTVYAAPAGGGASITFPAPLQQTTAATRLDVKCATTGANVRASASGFAAP